MRLCTLGKRRKASLENRRIDRVPPSASHFSQTCRCAHLHSGLSTHVSQKQCTGIFPNQVYLERAEAGSSIWRIVLIFLARTGRLTPGESQERE